MLRVPFLCGFLLLSLVARSQEHGAGPVRADTSNTFGFTPQSSSITTDTGTQTPLTAGQARAQRIEYVLGSAAVFSLVDYVGFNLINSVPKGRAYDRALLAVHALGGVLGAGINYFLYETLGLRSALSFDLIWWTWGCDMGFYGWTYLANPASPWINRTNNGLRLPVINWAGWTPIGLLRRPHAWIARDALLAQFAVGMTVSLAILW